MKRMIFFILFLSLLLAGCGPAPSVSAIIPPYVDTGIDTDAWVTVPAGEFPYGQHDEMTMVDYAYKIMVTDVTVRQYAEFLNAALTDGMLSVGEVEVEAGEELWMEEGVYGYYPGDPFHAYEHEEEITPGDKLHVPFTDGLRLEREGQTFTALDSYTNHPMTMVTWWGAKAYCQYYGWRLPTEVEWEGKRPEARKWLMIMDSPSHGARKSTATMPITTRLSISSRKCTASWGTRPRSVSTTGWRTSLRETVTKLTIRPVPTVSTIWPATFGSGWMMTIPTSTTATCVEVASIPTKLTCGYGNVTALGRSTTRLMWGSGVCRISRSGTKNQE